MAKYFVFEVVGTRIGARAVLLESQAPRVCAALWKGLPYSGDCGHAMLSGTVCALYIDPSIVAPDENSTRNVVPGDVMHTHYPQGLRHGFPDALSELYWAYDRYVMPTAPGLMAPGYPNVFGRMLDGAEEFYDQCRKIRRGGVFPLRVTGAQD